MFRCHEKEDITEVRKTLPELAPAPHQLDRIIRETAALSTD